ncbi:MAG: aldo/keto reductase [Prolixibacteraceae bacterium]|nr:aldo/keto reductase [Prolixibacteraceae bacterium]
MDDLSFSEKSVLLTELSPYVYGTTRLGDDKIPFDDRVEIAKAAIDTGVWFHTSHWYGNALEVLSKAFDADRLKVPNLIVKLGGESIDEIVGDIRKNTESLGIDHIELGQLCLGGNLAEEFASGGNCYKALEQLKSEGYVKRFVLEVFPWTSDIAYRALKGGYTRGIVDGTIFYLNPLQRFASNQLWDLLHELSEPIIAMRTVAGGPVHRLRDEPGFAWKEYLQKRAFEIAPIFERTGIETWTEFCVRFAHSFSLVRATVGSTANAENLNEFLMAAESIEPLPYDIVDQIVKLHMRWSDELDMKAEPWSM